MIMLSETAVGAVIAALERGMPEQCARRGIDTPSIYHNRDKGETSRDRAQVEVYEAGAYDMQNPYTNAGSGQIQYEIPVLCRVTVFARRAEGAEEMSTRARRYAAAITEVIVADPYLEGSPDTVLGAAPNTHAPPPDVDGDNTDKSKKVRTAVVVTVRMAETICEATE